VAHSGFLPQAAKLMLASREHRHDPELLGATRCVRGQYGRTLLMHAVYRGNVARATEILGACPTPAARAELLACVGGDECAALHIACNPHHRDEEAAVKLVELLLANGAHPLAPRRVPTTDSIHHAIHFAAQWSARLVTRLVQAGESIDGGVAGESALHHAASSLSARGVRMIPQLVALGARETLGNRAMMRLAQWPVVGVQPSNEEVFAALGALQSVGCSATAPEAGGMTPTDRAAKHGNTPVLRALLAMGVVPPATRARQLVLGAAHPAILRVLLAAGAPPNALAAVNAAPAQSPLMAAAVQYELESVTVLLAGGASVDFPDGAGRTALMRCVSGDGCDVRIIAALIDAGADVNARDAARATALHIVAANPRPWAAAVARLLLGKGADAHAKDAAGRTPQASVADTNGTLYQELFSAVV